MRMKLTRFLTITVLALVLGSATVAPVAAQSTTPRPGVTIISVTTTVRIDYAAQTITTVTTTVYSDNSARTTVHTESMGGNEIENTNNL